MSISGPGVIVSEDGVPRCAWCEEAPEYREYHDREWGRPVHGERALLERITLEAFQSGLSWLTILRKREAFREAFDGFSPDRVAQFGAAEVGRLLNDPRIVRNRAKIEAAVTNARATLDLRERFDGGLDALIWSYAPDPASRPVPIHPGDVPTSTVESVELARTLRRHGFRFVGPTTMNAAMQACGLVDDHLAGCHVRGSWVPGPSGTGS